MRRWFVTLFTLPLLAGCPEVLQQPDSGASYAELAARIDELEERLETLSAADCPPGYERLPRSEECPACDQIMVCARGRDEMVKVGTSGWIGMRRAYGRTGTVASGNMVSTEMITPPPSPTTAAGLTSLSSLSSPSSPVR